MNRRGFTIVELMMVIGVIAVLMTIVTTSAMSSMRGSREKRRDAMRIALESAIATYQAQNSEGKWPGPIESLAENAESAVLSESDAQKVFQIIVQHSMGQASPRMQLIDPNGLFVAPSGVQDGKGSGRSFPDARNGDGRRRQKMPVANMAFGYQGTVTGKFHRFNIVYHAQTDSVSVSAHCHDCVTTTGCSNGNCPKCHANEK